jgi:hypothetical protein
MKHERHHWLEKLQVEFAGTAALAITFFIIGTLHGSWDPQWPATYVSTGSFGGLLNFALLVWILATACAILTISARPEGALFATLVGAAGVSLHSAPIRVLFWSKEASLAGMFIQLIVELVVLFVIVLGAVHIIHQIRALFTRLCPNWMWRGRITAENVIADPTDALTAKKKLKEFADGASLLGRIFGRILGPEGMPFVSPGQEAKSRKTALVCTISCLAATVLYSSILLMLLMRSSHRGQIIFALFASFLLATLIAHQQFATRFSLAAWAAPLVTGIVFYMLAMASSGNTGTNIWIEVQPFARALPIDWMTAGAGGSVLGYWISERIHELRHIERHAENELA